MSKESEVCSQFSGKPWKGLKQGSVMIGMTLDLLYAGLFRTDCTGVAEDHRDTRWEVPVVVCVRGDMMKADGHRRNGDNQLHVKYRCWRNNHPFRK